MRHRKRIRVLDRASAARKALMKSLACSLIAYGHITTTDARAKALSPFVERMISLAKRSTLHSRRLLISRTGSISAADRLLTKVAPAFKEVPGGYTRRVHLGKRHGDRANQVRIEFVKSL